MSKPPKVHPTREFAANRSVSFPPMTAIDSLQSVFYDVRTNVTAERLPDFAGISKMNTAEHARIHDFIERRGETPVAPTLARQRIVGDGDRNVLSEIMGKHCDGCTAGARVCRWVFGEWRSGDERRPIRIGNCVGVVIRIR